MTKKEIRKEFKQTVIDIWEKIAIKDQRNFYYINEDSMKNRLYKRITNELGERFFLDNKVRLYTEHHVKDIGYADMALVDITSSNYKEWKVLTVIELKNKHLVKNTMEAIEKDYSKISKYLNELEDIDTFMISVNYNVDTDSKGYSWAEHFEKDFSGKNLVELILDIDDELYIEVSGYDWSKKRKKIIK